MQNRGAWQECAAFAASALRRELPGRSSSRKPLRIAESPLGTSADDAAARAAFTALGKNAPPGPPWKSSAGSIAALTYPSPG